MSLSPEDYQFIRERRRFVSSWPLIGGGALFVLLVIYAWLAIAYPHLANPAFVYQSLKNNTLPLELESAMILLAPVLMMLLFITIGVMLSFVFSFMRNEKRLLDMLDRRID